MDSRLLDDTRVTIVPDHDATADLPFEDGAHYSGDESPSGSSVGAPPRQRHFGAVPSGHRSPPTALRRVRSASLGSAGNGDDGSDRTGQSTRTSASLGLISSTSSSTVFPDAPDGGYGWVVVFASFMIHFIADGVSFSFGVMFPMIQKEFNATKGEAGFVASMFLALPLLAGPVASAVIDRYGCRPTVVVGGFISASGILLSYFAPNIWMLYFTFGLVAGLGLSFTFSGAIVAVTYYFDKKRALATGLTVCGTGLGTAVFAPLMEYLLSEYGWKGSLLILSGIMFNQVIFGLLIRDLEWPEDTLEYKRERFLRRLDGERQSHNSRLQSRQPSLPTLVWDAARLRRAVSMVEIPTYLREYSTVEGAVASGGSVLSVHLKQQAAHQAMHNVHAAARSRSVAANLLAHGQNVPRVAFLTDMTFAELQENVVAELVDAAVYAIDKCVAPETAVGDAPAALHDGCSPACTDASASRNGACARHSESPLIVHHPSVEEVVRGDRRSRSKEHSASDSAHQHVVEQDPQPQRQHSRSFQRVRRSSQAPDGMQAATLTPGPFVRHRGRTANILDPDTITRHEMIHARFFSAPSLFRLRRRKRRRHTGLLGAVRRLCADIAELSADYASLMRDFAFVLMLFSSFILYLFYDIMYVNMPEYVEAELGVTVKQASFVVSVIGFVNTGGMVLYGIVADWSGVNKVILYGISISICGVCTAAVYWLGNYYSLLAVGAVFGFTISANYTLASVIILDLMSLSDFVNAYGLMGAVEGVGTLIGPALCGYLFDWTGDYMVPVPDPVKVWDCPLVTFAVGGAAIVISGLFMLAIEARRCFCCCRHSQRHVTYDSQPQERIFEVDA